MRCQHHNGARNRGKSTNWCRQAASNQVSALESPLAAKIYRQDRALWLSQGRDHHQQRKLSGFGILEDSFEMAPIADVGRRFMSDRLASVSFH